MAIVVNEILKIQCPAFEQNGMIPDKFTCAGDNVSPELDIQDIPREAKSLALIVDDTDAPGGTFVHWIMWNIPPNGKIDENSAPGVQGKNGNGEHKYSGPCPTKGTHHYHFRVFALDTMIDLPLDTEKQALLEAIDSHILGSGEVIGIYEK